MKLGERVASVYRAGGRFILDHPIASWVMWGLAVLVIVPLARVALPPPDEVAFDVVAWVVVGAMAYTPVGVLLAGRWARGSAEESTFIRWQLAQAPWLLAWISAIIGTPQWLITVALVEAIGLMTWAMVVGKRSR